MAEVSGRNGDGAGLFRGLRGPAALGFLVALVLVIANSDLSDPTLATIRNDDAMRLVQVRDLLAGQGWFDTTQYRLGPEGSSMHWSRLVDAPIAGLILVFTPLLGQAWAEIAAMTVWPLVLLLPGVAALALAGRALGGMSAAYLAGMVGGAMFMLGGKFEPGSLDHHNLQAVLFLGALAGLLAMRQASAAGPIAGISMALALATGVEFLPHHALIALCAVALWVGQGAAVARPVRGFAASLGLGLALAFLGTAGPEAWRGGFCDALSRDLAVPVLVGAGGLWLLASTASGMGPRARLLLAAALVAAIGAATGVAGQACLRNPLDDLDPMLQTHWLERVSEARGLAEILEKGFNGITVAFAVSLGALVLALLEIFRTRGRAETVFLALILAGALALSTYQLRGILGTLTVAGLAASVVAARLYDRSRATDRLAPGIVGIALVVAVLPYTWTTAAALIEQTADANAADPGAEDGERSAGTGNVAQATADCTARESFLTLASLDPGLVSASSNLGSHILRFTAHRALSAPYHRNQAGMLLQLRIVFADDAEAERLLREAGVDYVVSCANDPEYRTDDDAPSPGFGFRLKKGEAPDFLVPVEGGADEALDIYRLTGQTGTAATAKDTRLE